jgi:hypothetical protein
MRKRQVDAAGVNVQRLAEILHGHGGAFDVPAGAAGPDGSFPEMLAGLGRFPEREVARALFFVAVVVDAGAGLDAGQVDLGKFAVVRKLGDAVVDRAFARIRERFLLQPLDELNHVLDVVGGADPVFGRFDAEDAAIVEKGLHEFLGVVANGQARGGGVGDDAVVHVGQVHDVMHFEAAELEEAAQDVLKNESAVVADVGVVVDGGAAGVHADFAGLLRNERLGLAAEGVVELNIGHVMFDSLFRDARKR